jgi:selT/selW/selH-like putative selenoprotein
VSKIIKKNSSNSKISSNRDYPRSGAFEIEIDGKIVYSKLKTCRFPTEEDINKLIK